MKLSGFVVLFVLSYVYTDATAAPLLYPYTLMNTNIPCQSLADCHHQYNHSWCLSGFLCIHNECKRIPEYPCRSTQQCDSALHQCVDIACLDDTECDNGLFCDGVEVCRDAVCHMNPLKPSCYYLGGTCDEVEKECLLPRWLNIFRVHPYQENDTTPPSQSVVNITSLIIIGSVMGIFFIVILIFVVGKSARGLMKQNAY